MPTAFAATINAIMLNDYLSLERPGPIRILLVVRREEDASRICARLEADHEDAHVTAAHSLGKSLQLLKQNRYDVLVVDHDLPDGTSFDLLGRIDVIDPELPVIVLIQGVEEEVAISVMKAGAADYVRRVEDASYETEISFKLKEALYRYRLLENVQKLAQEREKMRFIGTVRATVANVKHEINNPLSIISGNAQLLQELARMQGLGDDILEPLRDIEEASDRIAASLDKLADLKDIITRRYSADDNDVTLESRPEA